MPIPVPQSAREAWGAEVADDVSRWADAVRDQIVSRDEFREVLGRLGGGGGSRFVVVGGGRHRRGEQDGKRKRSDNGTGDYAPERTTVRAGRPFALLTPRTPQSRSASTKWRR